MALDENPLHDVASLIVRAEAGRGRPRVAYLVGWPFLCWRTLVRIVCTRNIRNMTDLLGAWSACDPKRSSRSAALGLWTHASISEGLRSRNMEDISGGVENVGRSLTSRLGGGRARHHIRHGASGLRICGSSLPEPRPPRRASAISAGPSCRAGFGRHGRQVAAKGVGEV